MKPERTVFILDLREIRKALHDSLHERIPVDDYMNEMYSARPIADFEIDGEHEIPGVYSSTGKPIICVVDKGHPSLAANETADARSARQGASWCECEDSDPLRDGTEFYDDGEHEHVWKHHYRCTRCGKITQIG